MGYKKLTPKRRKECFEILQKRYPKAFFNKGRKPFKIGIYKELCLALEKDKTMSRREIRLMMKWYCENEVYHMGVLKERHRIDLEGDVVEEVSKEDKAHSLKFLKKKPLKKKNEETEGAK